MKRISIPATEADLMTAQYGGNIYKAIADGRGILVRTSDADHPYAVICESTVEATESAARSHRASSDDVIEMNNYREDYVLNETYPDIPESFLIKSDAVSAYTVATNTGLILVYIDSSAGIKYVLYDLLHYDDEDIENDYAAYHTSGSSTRDRLMRRLISIRDNKFAMSVKIIDNNISYGIIDAIDPALISKESLNESVDTDKLYRVDNPNQDLTEQGLVSCSQTNGYFGIILLPYKRYYHFSESVKIYSDSAIPLTLDGEKKNPDDTSNYWYIETPFESNDIKFIAVEVQPDSDNPNRIMEVI